MVGSFASRYFSTDGFMPHGMCYQWQPAILALHVIADGIISLAYLSISCTLLYFVKRRLDLQHKWIFLCFALFIIACGVTHAMEIWTIWDPTYWLSGAIKALTAAASGATAILLIWYFPSAMRLPTPAAMRNARMDMEREIGERIRAEEDLRRLSLEQGARSAIAADAAGLGFWTFDVAERALHWDESMFRLYGITPSDGEEPEALRTNRAHLIGFTGLQETQGNAGSGGRDYDSEFSAVYPTGAIRHLKAVARITRDADGRAIRMLGVTFDITERRRAEEQFRLAIEAAPTGMLLIDLNGVILMVNAQIESIFGYPRAELLGRSLESLVPERFRANIPDFRNGLFSDPMASLQEVHGIRKDGSELPVEMRLNPLATSEGQFALCSVVDRSQRLEIDRIRNEFISTVSHELRTPLTSIRGSLGLLQAGAMGALPGQAAEMVAIAYKNTGRLVRIINDILDIGTIDSGKLTLQMSMVPLAELLQQSIEANAGFAQKCEVRLLMETVSPADRVFADPNRLMQVMVNLLSNAAKFSPPGGDVLIRVRHSETSARIEVEDSGEGIPEAFKVHVFEKFAQADASATRHFEGTGLGLNISRKLMEAMGGSIGFHAAAHHGTVFYIDLPRMDAAPTMLRATHLSETAAYKVLLNLSASTAAGAAAVVPRLLYVEDDDDLIAVIRAALVGRVEILAAHSLRDAERLLREQPFDLVVLDQWLPDGNGITLIDRIASNDGGPIPTIVLSVADVSPDVYEKVAAVLIKSQVSAAQVATTILSYLAGP
jgi:PAS domain S-box-containing protein